MDDMFRPTGIEAVGDKPWGTHCCLFYETKDDLIDILIPYFKAGLENHEFCLCVASEPVIAAEAERALKQAVPDFARYLADGQIEIVSHAHWYLQDGRFDPSRVRQGWIDRLEQCLAQGYAGMRFAANASWLAREDWDRFAEYEEKVDELFRKLPVLAVCAYALARCSSADMLDVVRHHQFSLVRRRGEWELLKGPELQRADAEIRRLNADLERRVSERTAQLAAANAELNLEIAERRRTEQSLQSVLATLPVGVIVTDREGDIVLSNAMAQQIWGGMILSGHERWAESKGFWHDSGKRIDSEAWASVRALRKGQTSLNELIDIETFDSQKKTIQNSAAPVRNAEGVIQGAVVVNEDVTEHVRAEEALRHALDRLQHLSRRLLEVQEEERRHIARELHDEFGQLLATISLRLHAARRAAGEAAQSSLAECMGLLGQAGEQVRTLALQLWPAMLETAGLEATLRWLAEQYQQHTGIATQVEGHLNGVPGDLAIACFRIVQEALTNIVRHARARHVSIELCQGENVLELVILDDGVGFDVERTFEQAAGSGRLGLLGMRERVQIIGGSLEVHSQPDRGTRIRVSVPLAEAAVSAERGE
jgi:signal transduction histidine kinase